jgi:hypothetical protein
MIEYEEKKIERLEKHFKSITCDLCGAKGRSDCQDAWGGGPFDVAETTVQMRTGKSYPDCYNYTYKEVDICTMCFKTKLIPWLESQGATVREREVSD